LLGALLRPHGLSCPSGKARIRKGAPCCLAAPPGTLLTSPGGAELRHKSPCLQLCLRHSHRKPLADLASSVPTHQAPGLSPAWGSPTLREMEPKDQQLVVSALLLVPCQLQLP
jgi:hypothetical protein